MTGGAPDKSSSRAVSSRLVANARRSREDDSAPDFFELDAGEIRADPLPRAGLLRFAAVHFQAPDTDGLARGQELEPLVAGDRAAHEASRDDGTEADDRKRAVDRKPGAARFPVRRLFLERQVEQRALQLRQPRSRHGGDRHDLRPLEKRAADEVAGVRDRDLDELGRDAIGLGHGDESLSDAEQSARSRSAPASAA